MLGSCRLLAERERELEVLRYEAIKARTTLTNQGLQLEEMRTVCELAVRGTRAGRPKWTLSVHQV